MDDTDMRKELMELRQRIDDWPSPQPVMDGPFPKVKIEKTRRKKL